MRLIFHPLPFFSTSSSFTLPIPEIHALLCSLSYSSDFFYFILYQWIASAIVCDYESNPREPDAIYYIPTTSYLLLLLIDWLIPRQLCSQLPIFKTVQSTELSNNLRYGNCWNHIMGCGFFLRSHGTLWSAPAYYSVVVRQGCYHLFCSFIHSTFLLP